MPSKKKLKRKIKRLQHKAWKQQYQRKLAEKDAKFWQDIIDEQDIEIEALKAPKMRIWLNDEEVTDGG